MSDSEDEDFAEYGTPLEPLDEDAVPRKKPFSLEDQVVRDKQGRRRFHGAFTGGFSAGFFNSVGSLEGWTPSTFTSSRSERVARPVQRPEDFMDDEDMGEFGIAPRVLRAKEEYSERGQKRQKAVTSEGPIPGTPVLQQLLQPARDTVGARLLRRMGWKPGQGVGPRLSARDKRLSARSKHQQHAPSISSDSSGDDDTCEKLTFAPGDYDPFLAHPKTDSFGIGYSGLDRRPVLSGHVNLFDGPSLVMSEKSRKVSIRGQAFGVGALEEDDEDIYGREDMSQYDFALDAAPSGDAPARSRPTVSTSGRDVLEGFVAAVTRQLERVARFPPPTLPPDYQPCHRTRASRFEPATGPAPARRALGTADRAVVVGEERGDDQQERRRLAEAAARLTEGLAPASTAEFRPFAAQPDKQRRYEQFLTLDKLGEAGKLAHLQPLSMTDWEKERERSEFEQASRLFRPLSADMSERFVPAGQDDQPTDPLAPVQRAPDKDAELRQAACLKMFGRLTRTHEAWQPCSLLCKRFNIPDPVLGSGVEVVAEKRPTPKFAAFEFLLAPKVEVKSEPAVDASVSSEPALPVTPVSLEPALSTAPVPLDPAMTVHVDQDTAALEFPDPPEKVDLFKAIFLSSSDDEDSGSETGDAGVGAVLRNTSPPRGVFANLDLDAINAVRPSPTVSEDVESQPVAVKEEECALDAEMYGPRLPSGPPPPAPADIPAPARLALPSVVGATVTWRERTADKLHRKVSKHKKHKKEKHKKKKKRKR
ncbi:G patch domain-containing protein 1 homolog [Bacillus rossius redtenbacheri]|uniref:G patch domain-containing protein 1 homolog n=1 Tax=Bacillus rossius redtenbacheri TaxID=93214 RepID=UPI002FDD13B4